MNRPEICKLILQSINLKKLDCEKQFQDSKNNIGYFFIDDLLPHDLAIKFQEVFPAQNEMMHKKSIREDKFVAAQMNLYDPILEELIYAFQNKNVVNIIGNLCKIENSIPNENL